MIGGSRRTAAVLASVLLAGPALADPKGPTEKDKQLAGDLVKKAIARSQSGDHAAAIEIYLQAYTIIPNPLLLSNIGAEFQQSGRPKEALRYFCMYLDLEKDPTGPSVPYAKVQAKALQIQLGNKNVDEHDVCAPPKPEAKPDPPKPPKPKDRPIETKVDPPPLSPGPEVGEPSDTPSGGSKLKYIGLGVGAAGLVAAGIGTYDGIQAKSISDQLTNHPMGAAWPDNVQGLQKRGQDYENLQIGFLIAGGVLVTTGVIMFVVGRSDESSKRSRDKPVVMVTPTTDGFAVFGTF